jgi:antitoxin PrlF
MKEYSMESSLTSKGQMTIPKAAREHLKARAGDRVKIFLHPDGTVVLISKQPASSIKGMFAGRVDKPVSVEQMKIAVEEAVAEEFGQ